MPGPRNVAHSEALPFPAHTLIGHGCDRGIREQRCLEKGRPALSPRQGHDAAGGFGLAETRKGRPNTRVVRTKLAPLGRPARRNSGAPPKKFSLSTAPDWPIHRRSLRKGVQLKPIAPKRGGRADTHSELGERAVSRNPASTIRGAPSALGGTDLRGRPSMRP